MTKKKQSPLIHIRLENEEAVRMKKELLYMEMNIVRALQIINRYRKLRKRNYEYKNLLGNKIKEAHSELNKLKRESLPKIDKTAFVKKIEKSFSEEPEIEEKEDKKKNKKDNKKSKKTQSVKKPKKTISKKIPEKTLSKEDELQSDLMSIQQQLKKLERV